MKILFVAKTIMINDTANLIINIENFQKATKNYISFYKKLLKVNLLPTITIYNLLILLTAQVFHLSKFANLRRTFHEAPLNFVQ